MDTLIANLSHPPVLFFFMGMIAVWVKSDLEIPDSIGKFFSLYLLFDIGLKGGEELFHSGITTEVTQVMIACVLLSFFVPFLVFFILRKFVNLENAGAIAAAYGSISAVTFATSVSFLNSLSEPFSGFMVAGMALMESPAIIAGLILISLSLRDRTNGEKVKWKKVFHEAAFNGSVYLLIGSLIIGILGGAEGERELEPFVNGIFAGMLSLYMLDMGLMAGSRLSSLKESALPLVGFALIYPIFGSILGMIAASIIGLNPGNSLLLTVLAASASYIAVPAAMRISVPKANMSLLLPMSLGVTFTFNVTIGIPLYYQVIKMMSHS
ncbi:MAG: sodium-dependent bicarbonate transport family permease [Bdellovibrionaceae bacterium]|nr:sodium-dependent bicarbonate transport family permease [Pseudobdellovibrionaceae bacterium]|tara:strand:+ start:7686 stop:8657 length:972 start_codon:yes stop_codon:yes gene_type:complete